MIPPRKNSSKQSDSSKKTKSPSMKKRSIASKTDDPVKEAMLKAKVISKKKVLFTEIDDEITGIYDKLKKYKMKNIYIVVPKRAIIFQSVVNLRILKRKAEDLKKTVYIITNDQNGMQLAGRAGFTVFDKLEGNEHPSLVSGKLVDDKMQITPLEASINTFEDDTPTRLKSRKISIAELIRSTKKSDKNTMTRAAAAKKMRKANKKKDKNRYVLVSPNRQALTILVTITVLILILITYIALPGATLYLTPKSDTLLATSTVDLVDAARNQSYLDTHPLDTIASYPVEITMDKTTTYFTVGNKFEGKNATGNITIYNTSNRNWPLIEQTRFQTNEGLVYRIQQGVTVPPSSLAGAGSLDVFIVADEVDANSLIIGEKGNIEPTKFFLPGLSEANQQKLYGESTTAFTGGETITHKMVTPEDLESARIQMEQELRDLAQEELNVRVGQLNQERNSELSLLAGGRAIEMGEPTVVIPEGLEGQMTEQFEVKGQMYVKGVAYNYNELVQILKNKLTMSKNPEKILIKIDKDSLSYTLNAIDDGDDPTVITITATMKGIEQYEISPNDEGGKRIIDQIREHIVGMKVEDAENYIQQLPSVNKVEISSWPAWAPTLPSVPDNIKIEIVDEL